MIWTQAGVFTEVHLTHAALTERFKDLVMTEGLADHRRLRVGRSVGRIVVGGGDGLQGRSAFHLGIDDALGGAHLYRY